MINNTTSKHVNEASIGYWASQEQCSMQQLIEFVKEAEKAERTKKMQFVTGVTADVYHYNPGIIAQAFTSLDVLHPGRISLGVGSG
jgi:coenzyme F420-dependent glucose-6-phosphate dehydrogenase